MLSVRNVLIAVAILAGVVVSSLTTRELGSRKLRAAQDSVLVARSSVKDALKRVAVSETVAKAEKARGDSALSLAQKLYVVAHRADSSAHAARAAFRALADSTSCDAECIQAAEDAFEADSLEIAITQTAYESAEESAHKYKSAYEIAQSSLDSLRNATVRLDVAAGSLVRASKPSLLRRVLPKPGVGLAAVIDPSGVPRIGIGVTLGWSF